MSPPLSLPMVQMDLMPHGLVSTHVPLSSHGTQPANLVFFWKATTVIVIVDLVLLKTNWIFKLTPPPNFRLKVVCKKGGEGVFLWAYSLNMHFSYWLCNNVTNVIDNPIHSCKWKSSTLHFITGRMSYSQTGIFRLLHWDSQTMKCKQGLHTLLNFSTDVSYLYMYEYLICTSVLKWWGIIYSISLDFMLVQSCLFRTATSLIIWLGKLYSLLHCTSYETVRKPCIISSDSRWPNLEIKSFKHFSQEQ